MTFQIDPRNGLVLEPIGQKCDFRILVAYEGGCWVPLTPVEIAQEGYPDNGHYCLGVRGHYPSDSFRPNRKMKRFYAVRLDRINFNSPYEGNPIRVWSNKNNRWVISSLDELSEIEAATQDFLKA